MNRIIKNLLITAALLFISNTAIGDEVIRITDNGNDGDVRFYSVVCPNGKRTAISNFYEEGKICTMLVRSLKDVCRNDWNIDAAAAEACK